MASRSLARGLDADITLQEIPDEVVGLEIVNKLATKGFCSIAPSLESGTIEQALTDIKNFDSLQRWYKVHTIIQEGLLGEEGSATIAELDSPELDDEERTDGVALEKLDFTLTDIGFRTRQHLANIGIDVSHRTLAVVHDADEPNEIPVALTEAHAAKWYTQFHRHRLMVVVFLGPSAGTLELKPYETAEANCHEVRTVPGTIVVLRPDLMSHKHFAEGRSAALSTFFLAGNVQKHAPTDGWPRIPPAKELDEWILSRLREIKEQSTATSVWDSNLPRDWQHYMNHLYHKGQMISVGGASCRFTASDTTDKFFHASAMSPDYVESVPHARWDHERWYDADLESWRNNKTSCRHGGFMEGIELFDCKMFSLSPQEATSMDPHQRMVLEVGYVALHNTGKNRKSLNNSVCGVYVGLANNEWNSCEKTQSPAMAFAATGGSLSIACGRFSFTLGLKGPSVTMDSEGASGAAAVFAASESCQKKGNALANEFAIGISASLLLSPIWWPAHSAAGWLSPNGRSMTFDASAAGHVRADGCAAMTVQLMFDVDDDGKQRRNSEEYIGAIAGASMVNNGRGAGLAAPHGPAEQEVVCQAIRNADISPVDVDHVEAHGSGAFLADAIEAGSLMRTLRSEAQRDPLVVTAAKSSLGNPIECGGVAGLLKNICCAQWGTVTSHVHLRQANPHIDAFGLPFAFASENFAYKTMSVYAGTMSRGFGGSNVYILTWGRLDEEKVPAPQKQSLRDEISFWPGGGGALEVDKCPSGEYTIVGTWSMWEEPLPMEPEGDGVYGYTVALGVNRWEQFQIWFDGDPTKVLHPSQAKASRDFPVLGPNDTAEAEGYTWMIDGRVQHVYMSQSEAAALTDGAVGDSQASSDYKFEDVDGQRMMVCPVATADTGLPGDLYRVRLRIAGKWRTVDWEKLKPRADSSREAIQDLPQGRYFIAAAWNDWEFDEMEFDPSEPGSVSIEVTLQNAQDTAFQIVRNKDWQQCFYPSPEFLVGDGEDSSAVSGPDELGYGTNWYISGSAGDRFRVTFRRSVDRDSDVRNIFWRKCDREAEQ